MNNIYKIKGVVQHYAWGGFSYIPQLLGVNNTQHQPFAEYWMGAHVSAPSMVLENESEQPLNKIIQQNPLETLTKEVFNRFGELPFLFKVLDVKEMLSIQVHPSKIEAEKGFDAEEAAGIPLNAANRNYKDRNHKPEVMVALSDFWLLHGFKLKDNIEQTLQQVPELKALLPLFKSTGIKELYRFVMNMEQQEVNNLLLPLIKREIQLKVEGKLSKADPGWWASKLFENKGLSGDIDKGIFSIYLFNIVNIKPGGAIFQKAGIPHAYLEGQNIELMANSDNVLRAGLTPKYIDVPELMKHTSFEEVIPEIMIGIPVNEGEVRYPCPVPDFGLSKIELNADLEYHTKANSLEILITIEGELTINGNIPSGKGEAVVIFPGADYQLKTNTNAILFKAFVPF
jgi:mannose-6-phosphate isomerase